LAKDKKSKIDTGMEIETMVKRIQELESENLILSDLVDKYDIELNNSTTVLEETTNKLREATDIIESLMSTENRPLVLTGTLLDTKYHL
jgi:hypothetical protein